MSTRKKRPATSPDGAAPAADVATVHLGHITPQLRPLAESVDVLIPDPANSRTHDEANLKGVAASLRVYGQRTPLVVNRTNNVVLKGNGTLAAARSIGWTHLAVVWVEDDPATAAGYSIADNRTAELAGWDEKALDALLRTVQTADEDLAAMFDGLAKDLDLVPGDEDGTGGAGDDGHDAQQVWQIVVKCADEAQQLELLERFEADGLECKAQTI